MSSRFPFMYSSGVGVEKQDWDYLHPEDVGGYFTTLKGCPGEANAEGVTVGGGYTFTWTINGVPSAPVQNYCIFTHRFLKQGSHDVRVRVERADSLNGTMTAEYQETVTIRDYLIVSLGDSYGSGEGAPDAKANWDLGIGPRWANSRCHRSFSSPSAKAALWLELDDPHSSVTYLSLACSGATISRVTYKWTDPFSNGFDDFSGFADANDGVPQGSGVLGAYVGAEPPDRGSDGVWEPWDHLPTQTAQLATLVGSRPIDALVLSAGGNDVGFGDILRFCVFNIDCHENGAGDTLRTKVDPLKGDLPGRYDALDTELKQLNLEVRGTYLMEYPDFTRNESGQTCPHILMETNILTRAVDTNELAYLQGYVFSPLVDMMQQAADRHGWHYVHGIADDFAGLGPDGIGHGLCASPAQRWMNNGYDAAAVQGPEGAESKTMGAAHPNYKGYEAMATRLQQTLTPTLAALPRIGVLMTDETFYAKDGALDASWAWQGAWAKSIALSGNRIGVLKTDGSLYVKEGTLQAPWVLVSSGVESFTLSGRRIGIIKTLNGETYTKEGPLDAPWGWQGQWATGIALTRNRLAVVKANGDVFVKEGPLDAPWAPMSTGAQAVALSERRIGVLKGNGEVYVKDGEMGAPWAWVAAGVKSLKLSGNRIGVLETDGDVYVQEGSLTAPWNLVSTGVQALSLSGKRIAVTKLNGEGYVKEGAWDANWTWTHWAARDLVLSTP